MKRIRSLVLIVAIFLLFSINNSARPSENFYEEAVNFFKKKDFEKSKFLFHRHLIFNPKDDLSYLYLAKIYKEEEDNIGLEKNLNTTLLLNPQNEEALYMLIELKLDKSNFSEVKKLNETFVLICSSLCDKKFAIEEKLNSLQTSDDTKK